MKMNESVGLMPPEKMMGGQKAAYNLGKKHGAKGVKIDAKKSFGVHSPYYDLGHKHGAREQEDTDAWHEKQQSGRRSTFHESEYDFNVQTGLDFITKLGNKNNSPLDRNDVEAAKQSFTHQMKKGVSVSDAVECVVDVVHTRLKKRGEYSNAVRVTDALRQGLKNAFKKNTYNPNESVEKLTFKQYLFESSIEHDLFVGRFQPFHKGHAEIVKGMKNPIVAVVKGKGTSKDKQNNPLSFEQQKSLILAVFPKATVIEVANANLYGILHHLKNEGKNIRTVLAGEDRLEQYKKTVEKSNKETGKNTAVKQTPRLTSATAVRNVIRSNDVEEYKKLMPTELADEETFKMLQKTMSLTEGRESEYAAWSHLVAQADRKRAEQAKQTEDKDETAKRFAKNMRANQLKVFQAELAKHKEALSKTSPGSTAHEIIKKRVDDYTDRINKLG